MGSDYNTETPKILFGLTREEDEQSIISFLELFCQKKLTSVLVPRMTDDEITETVNLLTAIMRSHLSHQEYHALFLGEHKHGH